MIATAHSPLEDDVKIIINIDEWETLNNFERVWMLLHEWGHEAFGMKHGDNVLMYPLMPKEGLKECCIFEQEKQDAVYNMEYAKNKNRGLDHDVSSRWARRKSLNYWKSVVKEPLVYFGTSSDDNNEFAGDDWFVPPAYNVLFAAIIDFFDDLVKNNPKFFLEYEYHYLFNKRNK